MAIAFRSAGARLKADVGATGTPQNVSLPAGHVSGDLLILLVLTDDNTNTAVDPPPGWTKILGIAAGTSTNSPYTARPRMRTYWRMDDGTLGSTVALSFKSLSWPNGSPYVLATVLAYTGCDTSSPIGELSLATTTATNAATAHPIITTATANSWLLTWRAVSSDSPAATFTNSVGTDVERMDDSDGFNELAFGLYDSGVALAAGAQPQRTTTASRLATYGSLTITLAIRPAAAAGGTTAQAGTASASDTAVSQAPVLVPGPWTACAGGMPVYTTAIDWVGNGTYTDPGDDITADELSGGIKSRYGRDQSRQLNPTSVGTMSLSVNNSSRKYSPENVGSILSGNLDPARNAQSKVVFQGQTTYLFTGKIDDFDVHVERGNRSVDFTFLDGLALLQGVKLSTPLYATKRTGEVINLILDAVGWTAGRDIDYGATVVPFWWVEGTDAFTAVQEIVKSEGPPSVAYVAPDGRFVFRDRHHRLLRPSSIGSQGLFASKALGNCASPAVTGFDFTDPFTYSNGWKDIVNSVSFDVTVRQPSLDVTAVWNSTDTLSLANGESLVINASGSDPFRNAITPVVGTDFTLTGVGTLTVQLSRTSGASAQITITAVGGSVQVLSMQLRANAVPVAKTVKIELADAASIASHGERDYPDQAPWAGASDAYAVGLLILNHYAQRLPTVQLRIASSDPGHWAQVVSRTVGDRITVQNDEMGMNADFFIESVEHQVTRIWHDRPPVHSVVLGCEKVPETAPANPFTFDQRGSGFDQGVFDPISSDDPNTIWIWDHPVQGTFDNGLFAT
jgi:hypothetical protein